MRPALFLDRDGILNEVVMRGNVVGSPRSLAEFRIVAGARELVLGAQALGYFCIVVTNQPDISRGLMARTELETMHAALLRVVPVDAIEVAEGGTEADPRKKPNPGMLLDAAAAYGLDLARSWIVGDSCRDMEAGLRAGVRTIFLEAAHNRGTSCSSDVRISSLSEVLSAISKQLRL